MREMLKNGLRPAYHGLRRGLDWLQHPRRRRRSLAAIRRARPESVLFVCHGNICRSPYAELAARALLPEPLRERVRIESAGFIGPDRPSPPEALAAAAARGVQMQAHRSKLLTRERIDGADLIFVVEAKQRGELIEALGMPRAPILLLGELDPDRSTPPTIPDPIGQALPVFERAYERIERCVRELVAALEAAQHDAPPNARGA